MADNSVIQFDIKVFYPNTKLIIEDINTDFYLINVVCDEQTARLEFLQNLLESQGNL